MVSVSIAAENESERGYSIQNCDLIDVWIKTDKSNRKAAVFDKICLRLNLKDSNNEAKENLMSCIKLYCLNMSRKWEQASRN
nr:unnamed protein product [Callosobruchus analis]